MHRIKDKMFLIFLLIFAILLAADQYTKYLAVAHLKGSDSIKLIDGVLELHSVDYGCRDSCCPVILPA